MIIFFTQKVRKYEIYKQNCSQKREEGRMKIKTEFRMYEGAYLKIGNYLADDSLAIEAWNRKDGCIARLTVCLNDFFLEENEAYVDTNNCPWVMDFIKEYQLGHESGHMRKSGYWAYPAVKFDLNRLKKYQEE